MCVCEKKRNEIIKVSVDVTIYIFYSHGTKVTVIVQQIIKQSLVP
jgi:hypothetical protein